MRRFYIILWFRWAIRITSCSVLAAASLSLFIKLFIYVSQGMPLFSNEILLALLEIFKFWFPISWSITLLLALFRGLKYIFNNCINGYELKLLSCDSKDEIENIGYGNLVKVWRKWFMLIIWLVGAQMILAVAFTYLFTSYSGIFEWFDIYFLFVEILIAGYFSFILLGGRCKQIKVVKC